jgi:Transglycosylase SLT domain.
MTKHSRTPLLASAIILASFHAGLVTEEAVSPGNEPDSESVAQTMELKTEGLDLDGATELALDNENIEPDDCLSVADRIERDNDHIPRGLLQAVVMTESSGWPWALNIRGKDFYPDSLTDAVHLVQKHDSSPAPRVDVGCTQVHLRWHPDAFASIEEALQPLSNITYSMNMLSAFKERHGSWMKAVGFWHGGKPDRRRWYRCKVAGNLFSIANADEGLKKSLSAGCRLPI